MIYKLVNSKRIIGKIYEEYNIDYSGFVSRAPNWIFSALAKMKIQMGFLSKTVEGQVTDYKALLPDECKILLGVSYKGFRIPRVDAINEKVSDDMPELVHSEFKYELDNNGYIITSFKECDLGDLKFYIKYFPLELDTTTNLYFPLIPENEDLFTALQSYVLMMLVQRGHKVGDLSLKVNNEYLNPAMMWERDKRKAKVSVNAYDIDEREKFSRMMRTFILDYNNYTQGSFNYKKIIE